MSSIPHKRALTLGLIGVILLAVGAWAIGARIRSPAQIAAETAAPEASLITVPVERRVLSTEVVVRGTVRYGAPQAVTLATSTLKQGSDVVSQPPRLGATLNEGSLALSVSGRPVFVLRGDQPMNRDLGPGTVGPDVRQLERALARLGFSPGTVDDRYDSATAAAVARWYQKGGWAPFGATEAQSDQLRAAQATAASARDALLQARLALDSAARPVTPAEVNQARIDAETAADAVETASLAITTAETESKAAQDKVTTARDAVLLATANGTRDVAAADAELLAKQTALSAAIDAQIQAQRTLNDAAPDVPPADREALQIALRQAGEAVTVARRALEAATTAVAAAKEAMRISVAQAQVDVDAASRLATLAGDQLARAGKALDSARRQSSLAKARVAILTRRADTTLQREVVAAAQSEVRRADADVARLAARAGIQLPADEVVFFPTLPLRIDDSPVKRGDSASTTVMTVSNSQLAADSSLSINDAKLVRVGMPVRIEEQDLGITVTGTVTRVADKPGTDKVDPTRVYFEVTPRNAPARLVGASVRLAIAVQSTKGKVLAVPLSALSVGVGDVSRVQVDRGGATEYVTVVPGLASSGLVEVRPAEGASLEAGDLVVVGSGGAIPARGATAVPATEQTGPNSESGTTTDPAATTTEPGAATTTDSGTGATTGTDPGASTDPGATTSTPAVGGTP